MGVKNGARWRTLKAQAFDRDRTRNAPCARCHQPIDYTITPDEYTYRPNAHEPDHIKPRSTHPHLTYELSNLRPSHASCNRSRGDKPIETTHRWEQAEAW